MARLHSSHALSTLSHWGNKVKHGAELLGTLKTAYDARRMIYGAVQPFAAAAMAVA